MKNYKLLALFVALFVFSSLSAQHDDLYFNPERDKVYKEKYTSDYKNTEKNYSYQDDSYYDDDQYDYDDNYDYYYSSRIRRFQRPMYGFNFYDPVYVDMFYYDPFLSPMSTMLIYDNMYSYNSWNRWNRWNTWGYSSLGYSPWGWNSFNTWDPWYRWNTGFYGANNFYNYGFYGGGLYCPPTWGSGYVYNTVNDIRNNTYYGPRTSGTTRIPRANDGEIRREAPKDVTNTPRQGGIVPDRTIPTTLDGVTPRDESRETPTTRARAHEERRRATDDNSTVTPRDYTPRENADRTRRNTETPRRSYDQPQQTRTREYQPPRTYEPPRQSTPSRSSGVDRGSSSSSPRSSGSSSSGPRSSSSSRRGGNE